MDIKIIISCILISLISASCQNEINNEKYKPVFTNEKIINLSINKNKQLITTYYNNGQLASIGCYLDGKKSGYWKEWYSDGAYKWEGKYLSNNRHYETIDLTSGGSYYIKDNPDKLKTNTPYEIKFYIPGIHPDDLTVASNNGSIAYLENRNQYDFKIIPERSGELKFYIYVRNSNGELDLIYEINIDVQE